MCLSIHSLQYRLCGDIIKVHYYQYDDFEIGSSEYEQQRIRRSTFITSYNSGRNFIVTHYFHKHMLPAPTYCPFCGSKIFFHETLEICCKNGKITIQRPTTPQRILDLYIDQTELGTHFRSNIRSYNNAFAFPSMGANIDQNLANATNGVYSYRVQGSVYHSIGSSLLMDGMRPRYLQLYIYDTDHEIENRQHDNAAMRPDLLLTLKHILDIHNPFVQVFRHLSQRDDIQNCRIRIKELAVNRYIHELPTASQVAGIIIEDEEDTNLNNRDIIVQTRSGNLQRVQDTAGFYDPLQYPLLLPYGEHGWDLHIHDNGITTISCRAYYSHLLQVNNIHNYLHLLLFVDHY